jgi:hypothetical protein
MRTSKFSRPHLEIRIYLPFEDEEEKRVWLDKTDNLIDIWQTAKELTRNTLKEAKRGK